MNKGLFRKGLVFGIIVLFVGAVTLPSTVGINKEKTPIPTIGNRGYIQDLIDNASEGDTIYIPSGKYYENIIIDKSINLIGENMYTTIIDGSGKNEDVIRTLTDWVNISGFAIANGSAGIQLGDPEGENSNHNTIKNNIFLKNNIGIDVLISSENKIIDNIITNNDVGIPVEYGSKNIIKGNIISNCGDGINLIYSDSNTISNNNCSKNELGIYLENSKNNNISDNCFFNCGFWTVDSYQNILSNNFVNDKPLVFLINKTNNLIDNAGQVVLINCKNITIKNLDLSNTTFGIIMIDTDNIVIQGNNICSNRYYGIYLPSGYSECNNNIITDNNVKFNGECGVKLHHSNNNIITNNTISNNGGNGLFFYGENSIVESNIFSNNIEDGISVSGFNNKIIGNIISYNNRGMIIEDSSYYILKDNIILDNNCNFGIKGEDIDDFRHDIDTTNSINGKPIYYLLDQSNLIFDDSINIGYLGLISCNNISIKDLIFTNDEEGLLLVDITYSSINNLKIYTNGRDGMQIYFSSFNKITNCDIHDTDGIYFSKSLYNTISDNNISNGYNGLTLIDSNNNDIFNNVICSNNFGINLQNSKNNNIAENVINSNKGYGLDLEFSSDNTLDNNDISNNGRGIFLRSSENTISNNTISNNRGDGIVFAAYSDFNIVKNNIISENDGIGIKSVESIKNSIIENNIISNNESGIILDWFSDKTIITGNNIILNKGIGLGIGESNDNTVIGNNISLNNGSGLGIGVWRFTCSDNIISNNIIRSNSGDGIILHNVYIGTISGNRIKNNDICSNGNYGISIISANNNIIFKNNFLDNKKQAFFEGKCRNLWLLNYWNRPYIFIKIIFGKIIDENDEIPWINFDWRPALKPYNI